MASSFPTKQPKGIAHVGQPVPTYNSVLLRVTPHVVMARVPPNATFPPNDSEYTSRAPGKNVLNPALHDPMYTCRCCPPQAWRAAEPIHWVQLEATYW